MVAMTQFLRPAAGLVKIAIIFAAFLGEKIDMAAGEEAAAPNHELRAVEVERRAIEAAFQAQVQKLYQVWMADETGQPARAREGTKRAYKAYLGAMKRLDEVERARRQQQ